MCWTGSLNHILITPYFIYQMFITLYSNTIFNDYDGVCFLIEIEKIKIFKFFYSIKSNLLILINIIKMNLLLISSVYLW